MIAKFQLSWGKNNLWHLLDINGRCICTCSNAATGHNRSESVPAKGRHTLSMNDLTADNTCPESWTRIQQDLQHLHTWTIK